MLTNVSRYFVRMALRVWIELEIICVSVRRGSREIIVRETWMIAFIIFVLMVGNVTIWTIILFVFVY